MRTILIGILQTLLGLILAPVLMLAFVFLIKWDEAPSYLPGKGPNDAFDPSFVKRGHLPSWLAWFSTMDMPFPGGMYEPTIKSIVGGGAKWRLLLASYIWAGHRNRMQGLAYSLGHQTTDYIPDPFSTDRDRSNWIVGGNVWTFIRGADKQVWRKLGFFYLAYGHQVYKLQDGRFWAVHHFSAKLV